MKEDDVCELEILALLISRRKSLLSDGCNSKEQEGHAINVVASINIGRYNIREGGN